MSSSGTSPRMQTLVFLPLMGAKVHIREIDIIRLSIFNPDTFFTSLHTCTGRTFDRFSWFMAQTTWFRKIYVLFGAQKYANSLLPQCKTAISNNSGSIKDRAVQFVYSRGFRPPRIDWFDRHLSHVTGSDHAHRFGWKQHLDRA